MASRAPFGTDLQPKFDVRVVAGKLIHTPVINTDRQLGLRRESSKSRSKDKSISGAITAHRKLKETQGHVTMDAQREGISRPRSKRSRSIDILPILEEGAGEALEEPSPLKLPNRAMQNGLRKDYKLSLPSIVVQPISEIENNQPTAELERNESGDRSELYLLIEPIFKPVVNKLGALRDIRQSCNRADSTNLGVLKKELVMNAFRSHGVKVSSTELSRLAKLVPCGMGNEHILYDKLCTTTEQVLNKKCPNTNSTSHVDTLTPIGSIDSGSLDSIEDFDPGCSLPMLADRTNSLQPYSPFERPSLAKPKLSRTVMTHPLSNSHSLSKLPPVSESSQNINTITTAPAPMKAAPKIPPIRADAEWPQSMKDKEEREDGVEKMYNALRSCTDSEGLLESDHAQRVVQNYNVIYKLGLPPHQIRDYIKINSRTKTGDLRPYISTDHFLQYLSVTYLHVQ